MVFFLVQSLSGSSCVATLAPIRAALCSNAFQSELITPKVCARVALSAAARRSGSSDSCLSLLFALVLTIWLFFCVCVLGVAQQKPSFFALSDQFAAFVANLYSPAVNCAADICTAETRSLSVLHFLPLFRCKQGKKK